MEENAKLNLWRERLSRAENAYAPELSRMDERETLYRGSRRLRPFVEGVPSRLEARHVQNIIAENIDTEIDPTIPYPRVTARRREDEWRAEIIENMLKNELDRLRVEEMNDLQERTVPIQGGGFWLVEWDSAAGGPDGVGEVALATVHPKHVIPEEGITNAVEDMDYIIVRLTTTRDHIRRRYGVDLDAAEPDASPGSSAVTQYIAYYRGEDGGIGLFSWAEGYVLEDLEDYQSRRVRRCAACGALWDAPPPGDAQGGKSADACRYCGAAAWVHGSERFEEIYTPRRTAHGAEIPGAAWALGEGGELELRPTLIPAYRPNVFPVVLQRNVSVYGQLLGESDVDRIADLQNVVNWLNYKIDSRLMSAGTIITGPAKSSFTLDPEDGRILRLDSAADKALIDTYEFTGDVNYHSEQLARAYEAARQVLGITDSYQGRQDRTATSGRAKEFAAAQSAGRLESKRVMKASAYAKLFELIFKFRLAYADEPRPVVFRDAAGGIKYDSFDRYDFLERDPDTGEWRWIDAFLFSCDSSAPLSQNREAMWQEARLNFTSGAYGDPGGKSAQLLFWSEMERLRYPLAAAAKKHIAALADEPQTQDGESADDTPELMARLGREARRIASGGGEVRSDGLLPPDLKSVGEGT